MRAALELRKKHLAPTRVVVSVIRQEAIEGKLQEAIDFWLKDVGVDEVITRKFLTWDDNTSIPQGKALDKHLYAELPSERKQPCVWPFERLNVDTLGRISLPVEHVAAPNLLDRHVVRVREELGRAK